MEFLKKKIKLISSSLIVFVFLSFTFFYFYREYSLVLDILYPFQIFLKKSSDFFSEFKDIIISNKNIYEENLNLTRENNQLKFKIENLKYLENENEKLRKLLLFSKETNFKRKIAANVIGYPSDNWIKAIIIDAGIKKGVKVGDIVLSDGYLVGKITKVGVFSSFVLLTIDSNFKITGRTQKTREFIFYKGNGKDGGFLEYIKPHQDIRVGDIVETNTPKGIPIGVIKEVSFKEGKFLKFAKVKSFVNQFNLEYVLIIGK